MCEQGHPSAEEVQSRAHWLKVGLPTNEDWADTLYEIYVMKKDKLRRIKSRGNGLNVLIRSDPTCLV